MTEEVPSFLSKSVKHIICEAGLSSETEPDLLDPTGLIQWSIINSKLLDIEVDTPEYFLESVKRLASSFNTIHHYVQSHDEADYFSKYRNNLKWMTSQSLIETLYTEFHQHLDGALLVEWMLLLFPVLERSLGDIYLLRGRQCPSILRDLLLTEELKEILGPEVVQLLRIIIGPPISLNLRNVMWHGFPACNEIPTQYASFMLVLLPSLGKILAEKGINVDKIPHRTFVTFPQKFQNPVPNPDFKLLRFYLNKSSFINLQMLDMWSIAFKRIEEGDYGRAVTLLLPQLEHGCRQIFAAANKCPERVLTAESSVFFTTFDEILAQTLSDGSKNQFLENVGDGIFGYLLDFLTYPEGPRVRDKLSHGEMNVLEFPKELCYGILTLCLGLALKCCPDEVFELKEPLEFAEKVKRYKIQFHPIPLLKQQIVQAATNLTFWINLPRPSPDEIELSHDWTNTESMAEILHRFECATSGVNKLYPYKGDDLSLTPFGEKFLIKTKSMIEDLEVGVIFR